MWFKNLALFRFTEPCTLDSEQLEKQMEQMRFHPCGSHQEFSFGWVSPLGRSAEQLVYAANGFLLICAQKEEKVLPAAVINDLLQEKTQEAEEAQNRKLGKKERAAIKDELIFDLLPRAFSFSRRTFAYIDPKGGWLIVDSGSAKKAEDLVSLLRKGLGTLPVVPPSTNQKPSSIMTQWLVDNQPPGGITLENECELRSPEDEGGIIRCKKQDLTQPEIKNHLDTGKQVLKLAVNWNDRMSFILDESLTVKRLRFLDMIQDQAAEADVQDEAGRFDVDFSIMSLELAGFLPRLMELFGGENQAR